MTHRTFIDVEDLVMSWLRTTSVAPLITTSGSIKAFLAMPKSAPLPAVVLSRVGGAPEPGDTPVDVARISFSIYAANRPQAKSIVSALVSEIESLGYGAPYQGAAAKLQAGTVVLNLWLPEPGDEAARYVVDAVFPVISN